VPKNGSTHDKPDAARGAPSEYVRIVVADTGDEMSADAQSRLFEPFFASKDGVPRSRR
jgi:signal transduction histidine kinase